MPVPLEVEAPASLVTEAVVRAVVHVAKLSAEREIHVVSQKEVPAEIGALQHSIGQIVLAELGEGEGLGLRHRDVVQARRVVFAVGIELVAAAVALRVEVGEANRRPAELTVGEFAAHPLLRGVLAFAVVVAFPLPRIANTQVRLLLQAGIDESLGFQLIVTVGGGPVAEVFARGSCRFASTAHRGAYLVSRNVEEARQGAVLRHVTRFTR